MSVATVNRSSPFSSSVAIGLKSAAVATNLTISTSTADSTRVVFARPNTLYPRPDDDSWWCSIL